MFPKSELNPSEICINRQIEYNGADGKVCMCLASWLSFVKEIVGKLFFCARDI